MYMWCTCSYFCDRKWPLSGTWSRKWCLKWTVFSVTWYIVHVLEERLIGTVHSSCAGGKVNRHWPGKMFVVVFCCFNFLGWWIFHSPATVTAVTGVTCHVDPSLCVWACVLTYNPPLSTIRSGHSQAAPMPPWELTLTTSWQSFTSSIRQKLTS